MHRSGVYSPVTLVSWEAAATLAASGVQQSTPKLRFAQISDSHIGFHGPANPNITDTFNHAIGQINSLGYTPDFVIHTGDLTHLATPAQFDQVQQMMTGLNAAHVFTVPSEHDSTDAGQKYRQAFGAGTRGDGRYSFEVAGVHIIGLVNTLNLQLFSKTEGNVTFYTGTGADLTLETAGAVTVRDELATVPVVVHWRDGHAASSSPTSQSQRHSSSDSSHGT